MASFDQLLSSLSADPSKKGKRFEHFAKWFLENDPAWSTKVAQVWLWDDYPDKWQRRELGTDLVCRFHNGEHWAIQAKCYDEKYSLNKADIDSFLSDSSRKSIHGRILIATTDKLGPNLNETLKGQEKPVVRILLNDLQSSALSYPEHIDQLRAHIVRVPFKPREHQSEAIAAVTKDLASNARGQLIMACGTGKTLTALWVKEAMKAQTTLVLVPSLSLLSQTLKEWTANRTDNFIALCVCSDDTVGKREDAAKYDVEDLAFPVTTDAQEIAKFLSRSAPKVIFSTYQSSPQIAKAQVDHKLPSFDLVVADEAHKCAGKVSEDFGAVLDGQKLRADKRLFMTATPRLFSAHTARLAADRGVDVVSMDDVNVFGAICHKLSFSDAIKRDLLSDYRVVIVGVDDPTITEFIQDRELLKTETGIETDAESLAAEIGLLKVIKEYDLKRVITFHSYVKSARNFSLSFPQVVEWVRDDHKPTGKPVCDYISGDMPTSDRTRKLRRLGNMQSGERGIISNARCLSEGIDVPALDGVVFMDSKRSTIDIVQAVGRAIRKSADKTYGTIVLPVFIGEHQNAAEEVAKSRFNAVWDCLNALRAHDDDLAHELDELRTQLGKRGGFVGRFGRITFDLPRAVSNDFAEAFKVRLLERTTASWMFWYGLLETFKARYDHCDVPKNYKTAEGLQLGVWLSSQRVKWKKGVLPPERVLRLEELGVPWDERKAAAWNKAYDRLKTFKEREGHCDVPSKYKTTDGYRLGGWLQTQRQFRLKDKLSPNRIALLEEIGVHIYPHEQTWAEGYEHSKDFKEREGHCHPPKGYTTVDGFPLRQWLDVQKTFKRSGRLSPDRICKLERLGFVWDQKEAAWIKGYEHLKSYIEEHGNRDVSRYYIATDGFPLGRWLGVQRKFKSEGKLLPERSVKLEELGVAWNYYELWWAEGYEHLRAFKEKTGHCKVPHGYKTAEGFRLYGWIAEQRNAESDGKLSPERTSLLMELGLVFDPQENAWTKNYEYFRAFKEREGHCDVPTKYKTVDGFPLGKWLNTQRVRKKRETLSQDRIKQLEELGVKWAVR